MDRVRVDQDAIDITDWVLINATIWMHYEPPAIGLSLWSLQDIKPEKKAQS